MAAYKRRIYSANAIHHLQSQSVCVSRLQTHISFQSAICLERVLSRENVKFTTNASKNKKEFNLQNGGDPAHFFFSNRISV